MTNPTMLRQNETLADDVGDAIRGQVRELRADAWDIKVDPGGLVRIPDGDYSARYLGHETAFLFNSGKIILRFQIVEGPHSSVRLTRPYRAKRLLGRPAKSGQFELGVKAQ